MRKNEIQKTDDQAQALERVLIGGDLSKLTSEQRIQYYAKVCEASGLNPVHRPLQFLELKGKTVLYLTRGATDQLRSLRGVSIEITRRETIEDIYVVTAKATIGDRSDESTGAVPIKGVKGEELANAYMKAECVPLEYEILTRRGFMSPLDLTELEEALTIGPDGRHCWVPIEGFSIYEDQLVKSYGNTYLEAEFTEGHKWLAQRHAHDSPVSLLEFEEMNDGHFLVLAGDRCTDPGTLDVTERQAAALGWIVTDGTTKQYKGKPYRASVCQSKTENFETIEWALSELSPTRGVTDARRHGWRPQHWWYLNVKNTAALFEAMTFRSNEDLPRIAASLGPDQRRAMLAAMMAADGDKRGIFGKTKREVIECFQILSVLEGSMLSKCRERWMSKSTKPIYLQQAMKHKRVARRNLEELGERRTTVWCPTTMHGNWFCRTPEGQVFCTGNSKAKRRATISITGLGLLDESEALPGKAVATPEPQTDKAHQHDVEHHHLALGTCETRPDVDTVLANAKADLDVTEMQELQTIAGEHLASLGIE